ncbi:MAG: hypothetical protein KDJ47_05870 [Hyphomicrobiaceae bacterium]|nr:hypothetical protein [Hyphomicrobiaceae bacterium]
MKIETMIDICQPIEVEVSADDMIAAILDDPDAFGGVLRTLNNVAGALRAIPDYMIDAMSDGQRETVAGFLAEQGKRYSR